MDQKVTAVLDAFHFLIEQERSGPRQEPVGGRDGGQDMRMRAIGPETGQLLNILVKSIEMPRVLELGTSFGYSGIWLGEAARATGGKLITMELHAYKSAHAQDMAAKAGLTAHIDFRIGDAVPLIRQVEDGLDFVFVDLWKDLYLPCWRPSTPSSIRARSSLPTT